MVNRRSTLYNVAKTLALSRNVAPPRYRTSTIVSLQNFIDQNQVPQRPILPFLNEIRASMLRYVRNRPFGQIEIELNGNEVIEPSGAVSELTKADTLKRTMSKYLANGTEYKVAHYTSGGLNFENKFGFNITEFNNNITIRRDSPNREWIELGKMFGKLRDFNEYNDTMRKMNYFVETDSFHPNLFNGVLVQRADEVDGSHLNGIFRFIPLVDTNPLLEGQRNGVMNCACKLVFDELSKSKSQRTEFKKKHIHKINEKYLATGIGNQGLQELADKSYFTLVVKDKIGKVWHEFKPSGENKKGKKLLMLARNNHISHLRWDDECGSDSEDEGDDFTSRYDFDHVVEVIDETWNPKVQKSDKNQETIWFSDNQAIIDYAHEYERDGKEGIPIISKGELVAYITPSVIKKKKFHEHELYPQCFTNGGVGKAKFIEQMKAQGLDHYEFGINDSDPFFELLMDANRTGFYSRTSASSSLHTKYDQNKAYKSFNKSGIFNGFPILEAVFKVDKSFSDFSRNDGYSHGLLYVEWDTLSVKKLNSKIYYEGNGWYPIEIVKKYYEFGVNPFIRSYAYASKTFNVDFEKFTNDQFRTFMGKCVSKSFDEVWRTKDYAEFMRARYILRERVISFQFEYGFYQIIYTSDKNPWNMPVLAVYVHAHQKYNLFQQYNKLIENGIIPIAVNVDGIEVPRKCDHLFDLGTSNGQWKLEKMVRASVFQTHLRWDDCANVIERPKTEHRGTVEFNKNLIIPQFLHISGAGGNGKSQHIIELAKVYPNLMYLGPTHDAVKNLLDKAKEINVKINATTYHKVFGFGCEDRFSNQRLKYSIFILDECSMLSAENLKIIISKLNTRQSLILAGDFWQLPCVEETPIFDNWTGKKSTEYEKFEIRELTKNWRQETDAEFFSLCNSLRGELSEEKARKILSKINTRVVPLPENNSLDDIHICGTNEQIAKINDVGWPYVGCKVICNISCTDAEGVFIPNGSIGIINTICSPELKTLFSIRWADGTISKFKNIGKTKSKKPRFTPAYALTVHKAQGKTIKRNVIINPTRLFAKNHLYVALTRATQFSSIFLTQKMTFDVFCKTVNVELQ